MYVAKIISSKSAAKFAFKINSEFPMGWVNFWIDKKNQNSPLKLVNVTLVLLSNKNQQK